jgi:hypothetical protein
MVDVDTTSGQQQSFVWEQHRVRVHWSQFDDWFPDYWYTTATLFAYRAELERLEFNEIVSLQDEFSQSWSPYVLCGTVKASLTDEPDRGRVL